MKQPTRKSASFTTSSGAIKFEPVKLPELVFGIRADARQILHNTEDSEIQAAAERIITQTTNVVAILAQADGFDSLVLPPEAQAQVTAILQKHLAQA